MERVVSKLEQIPAVVDNEGAQDFPDFKNYETYFEVNTRRIKRFKTIEENNIKNNDIINVFRIEE